jgi:hypothetical protein
MPDLLINDIAPKLYERLRRFAESQGKSLEQVAREILTKNTHRSAQRSATDFDLGD